MTTAELLVHLKNSIVLLLVFLNMGGNKTNRMAFEQDAAERGMFFHRVDH